MKPMNPLSPTSPIVTNNNNINNNNNNNGNNPQSPNPQQWNQQAIAANLFNVNAAAQQQQGLQQMNVNTLNNVSIPSPMNNPLHIANQVVSPSNSVHSSSSIPSTAALPTNLLINNNGMVQPQNILINQPLFNPMYQQQGVGPNGNPLSPQNQPINPMNNNNNNNNANMRNININNNMGMQQHPLSPHGGSQQAAVLQDFANNNNNNNGNNNRNNGNKNNHRNHNGGHHGMNHNIIHSPNASSSNHHGSDADFDCKALSARLREQYMAKREEWQQLQQNEALFDTLDRPLVEALLLPKHRPQILDYEQKIINFLNSDASTYRFPANLSSFNRLLLHRLSETFKLDHHVEFVDNGNNNRNKMDNRHRDDQNKAVTIYKMKDTKLYVLYHCTLTIIIA